jgi:hypothetical protein
MKFVHPEILWALSAVSIPIIVHLFNFRKFKKVLFSNVAFLQEIQQETKSKSKLKHLLILIARMLAIACLVFAFAQPYFPVDGASLEAGDKAISLYIDNSFSSESKNEAGPLLEIAKSKAIEIVEAHKPTDKFQVLSNEFDGSQQRLMAREEAIEVIQKIEVSPSVRKWSEVVSRQEDVLKRATQKGKISYILSDFQTITSDIENIKLDSTITLRLVPGFAATTNNLSIDSVWFNTPVRQLNQVEELYVRVRNFGDKDVDNVSVSLKINGQSKSVSAANVAAFQSQDIVLSFTNTEPGIKEGEVLIDDSPVTFDNSYYFSYQVASQIRILEITGADVFSDPVATLFNGDPYFALTTSTENSIDYSALGKQDLIILQGLNQISSGLSVELEKYISNGGSVCVFPSSGADITSYNSFLQKCGSASLEGRFEFGMNPGNPVSSVNYDHFLLKGILQKKNNTSEKIDYPNVGSYFKISNGVSSSENILTMQSGDPFFTYTNHNGGKLYMSAVTLKKEESSFTSHSFFPTLLLRVAESSTNQNDLSYFLGKEQAIQLKNLVVTGEQTFRLLHTNSNTETIPEHRNAGGNTELFIHTDLNKAGSYHLMLMDSLIAKLSFNFDRKESDLVAIPANEVQDKIDELELKRVSIIDTSSESISKFADEIDGGKKMWYTMLVWALIFLAIEILLIKYWR